jgi:hypothetical protein
LHQLFHNVSETFSIAVGFSVFLPSWSSRSYLATRSFVFPGVGYLFAAVLELLRTLKYGDVTSAAVRRGLRYEALGGRLRAAGLGTQSFVSLARLHRIAPNYLAFVAMIAATAVAVISIFWWNMFPIGFLEGQGGTLFKKASEPALTS